MVGATLAIAIAVGLVSGSGYASRYTAVVFGLFILLIALGTTVFADPRCVTAWSWSRRWAWRPRWGTPPTSAPRQVTSPPPSAPRRDRATSSATAPISSGPRSTASSRTPTCSSRTRAPGSPAIVDWVDYEERVKAADPIVFADLLDARAGPGHDIFLVWSGAYRTHIGVCEQIVVRLSELRPATRVVEACPSKFYENGELLPVPAAVSLADRRGDGARLRSCPGGSPPACSWRARAHSPASWSTSYTRRWRAPRPVPIRACWHGTAPGTRGIAEHGYAPLPDEGIRFFPRSPSSPERSRTSPRSIERAGCGDHRQRVGPRARVVALPARPARDQRRRAGPPCRVAHGAGADRVRLRDGLHRSHRDRVGGRDVPRAAYPAVGVGGAVRSARGPGPPGRGAARRARRHRSGPRLADRPPAAALAAVVAVVAPAAGAGAYLGWVQLRFGDWLLPVRIQQRHNLRAARSPIPSPPSTMPPRGLLDGTEVGTGLHVPWALLLAVGVILAFRYWPVSYGAFAAVMLVAGVSSSNLDSLERYALSAFPFVLVAAGLLRREWLERSVLVLSGAAMVGYAVLVFLSAAVP